jgi:hypothetical protein
MPKGIVQPTRPKGTTAGYPEVEYLIETEDFAEINEKFKIAYEQLEGIARHKRGLKKSREARKAMKAMELVMDLFRELLTIKYRLQEIAASKMQKNP